MSRNALVKCGAGVLVFFLLLALAAMVHVQHGRSAEAAAVSFGDPIGNYNFRVEIEGVSAGRMLEVSGLTIEQEIIEFRVGTELDVVRKLPGRVKYGDITLKRGYVPNDALALWIQESFKPSGDVMRKDGALVVVDRRGREVARFHFYNAWPAKWSGPIIEGHGVVAEEIILAVEWFERG